MGGAKYVEKLPKGTHSVKGCGSNAPDPTLFHEMRDGVKIPLGKGVKTKPSVGDTSLLYNEYPY